MTTDQEFLTAQEWTGICESSSYPFNKFALEDACLQSWQVFLVLQNTFRYGLTYAYSELRRG